MIYESGVAMMPYNTRRKLLSLPSLGINLPVSNASRTSSRSSPPSAAIADNMETPSKKPKRSHLPSFPSAAPRPRRAPVKYENTPPPSPVAEKDEKEVTWFQSQVIDLKGIKDEIVEAVIVQLQKSGNRPHLVKELAMILSCNVKVVEQSANPSAIISSRLSSFIKRPWSPIAPCPIAKELETIHPRRTHYFLTTIPRLPISDSMSREFAARAIISPSISSDASRYDEIEADRRRELSPSPEIDLFSHDYDDENGPDPSHPPTSQFPCQIKQMPRNLRSTSPPLEKDEKEFTQAARGMQKRKFGDLIPNGIAPEIEEYLARNPDCNSLFGKQSPHSHNSVLMSSPVIKSNCFRPSEDLNDAWSRSDADWDIRSPETVELEELDGMLDCF